MFVLAIDTALGACSAAVLDTAPAAIIGRETVPMQRGHAEALMPMIARVMDQAAIEFDALDRIAVTVGPGSFTGLRVGIAAARGIALASGKPAVGLTTLAAFAAPHIAANDKDPVIAAIDARHEQVYMQIFGPGGRTLLPPCVIPLREAARAADVTGIRVAGTAAAMLASVWPAGMPPPGLVDTGAAPDIDWVARLGAAAPEPKAAPKPLYLRPVDAQPQQAASLPRR